MVCGYFLAATTQKHSVQQALQYASAAAALAVSRHGASDSIPALDEVTKFLTANPLPGEFIDNL